MNSQASQASQGGWEPPRRLLVIVNPMAGGARHAIYGRTLDGLRALGCNVAVVPTAARGDAERFARAATALRYDAVVVAGGDGTINEVVNGLAQSLLPLAVIPLGTANVLAAELGLPGRAGALARLIALAPACAVHVGEANGRRFSLMVGVGFDARVVENVNPRVKRALGKLAYVWQSIVELARYRAVEYAVEIDGRRSVAAAVVVAKGRFYGGRFRIARAARLEDPNLHVCLFARTGRWHVLRYSAALLFDRIHRLPDVRIVVAARVRIEGVEGEAAQGDGDVIGVLPLAVALSPRSLLVIA